MSMISTMVCVVSPHLAPGPCLEQEAGSSNVDDRCVGGEPLRLDPWPSWWERRWSGLLPLAAVTVRRSCAPAQQHHWAAPSSRTCRSHSRNSCARREGRWTSVTDGRAHRCETTVLDALEQKGWLVKRRQDGCEWQTDSAGCRPWRPRVPGPAQSGEGWQ